MKIKPKSFYKKIKFEELDYGDIFKIDSAYYMKVRESYSELKTLRPYTSITLYGGLHFRVEDDFIVDKVEGSFVEE